MIPRYTLKEMADVWSEDSKLKRWLEIELTVCEKWCEQNKIPPKALANLKKRLKCNSKRMAEIEKTTGHDVIAFLEMLSEQAGDDARFIHMGMTSSDLVDTAFAAQITAAAKIILKDIDELLKTLKDRAFEFKSTPMAGRTHGIHAEPITFGLKIASWYSEFLRQRKRFEIALADIAVGKISGVVGTFAHMPMAIEEAVCKKLSLGFDLISTQVVSRDRHANFFSVLAGIASSVERIAVEIRHLQRTEISEVAEPFGTEQKGSSAMPHKRNPVLCENLTGLARLVRSYAQAALENNALWHERDISHSSVERVIAPDATILVDFMLFRLNEVLSGLKVFPSIMKKNLEMGGGLIHSQRVLLALVENGMKRDEAYRIVQRAAFDAWEGKGDFKELLEANKKISSCLSKPELKNLFDLKYYFRNVDAIFKRVFCPSYHSYKKQLHM